MKKLVYLGLTLLVISGLLLTGCGSSTTETATVTSTQTATQTATQTTTQTATETATVIGEEKIIRLAHPLPPMDVNVLSCIEAADEFNAVAAGRYKIEVYPGGVLAGMMEGFDLVRQGAIDITDFSPDFLAEKDLYFGAQSLPFAFKDYFAEAKYLDLIRSEWEKRCEEKYGVKLLFVSGLFSHNGWCGTEPVKTLDDWKGKVVWCAGPAEADALTLLGASPTTMDWGDGYPAIEKGTVDGGTYGIGAAWMSNWTACKYFTSANMFASTGALGMNLDVWNEMPADLQDALMTAMKHHEERIFQFMGYEAPEAGRAAITDPEWGGEVYDVPADELTKWKAATASVAENYYAQLDPADAAMIKAWMEEANQ